MVDFQQAKQNQLSRKDKSNKGCLDKHIKKLCDKINSNKNYYTTSSCSGRIILIKSADKKGKKLFLFRTHDKISFNELKKQLKHIEKSRIKEMVYFKQEPCILHVASRSLADGLKLLMKAREAGWKRSGMIASGKRIILELMSTEHIEMPIVNKGKILVSDSFLKLLVNEANNKLARTWQKIKTFEERI